MLRRRMLVQTMLAALLACALAGIAVVFLPSATGAGRLSGSAAVLVLACALLMPLSGPAETQRPSMSAVAWLGLVLGAAALAFVNIWSLAPLGTASELASTLLWAWCGFGLPVGLLLLATLRKAAGNSGVRHPATVTCAVIGGSISFIGTLTLVVLDALETAAARDISFASGIFVITLGATVTGAANLAPFRDPPQTGPRAVMARRIGALGFTCTLVAVSLACALLEFHQHPLRHTAAMRQLAERLQPACVAIAGLAVSAGIWSPVSALGFRGWAAWLAPIATTVTLAITVLLTIVTIDAGMLGTGPDLLPRTCVALAIVDASALVTVALLSRFRRPEAVTEDFVREVQGIELRCPRCTTPRFATLGESACRTCGLAVLLAVRDDTCPGCGYDLRHAQAGACPECGRARQVPTG